MDQSSSLLTFPTTLLLQDVSEFYSVESSLWCDVRSSITQSGESVSSLGGCICSQYGSCSPENECRCSTGFTGQYCQFTQQSYDEYHPAVNENISLMETKLATESFEVILNELEAWTQHSDLVSTQSVLTSLSILNKILDYPLSLEARSTAFKIHSSLSSIPDLPLSATKELTSSITQSAGDFLLETGEIFESSCSISVASKQFDLNSFKNASQFRVTLSSHSVLIPHSALSGSHSYALLALLYSSSIYTSIHPSSLRLISPVMSLSLFQDLTPFTVRDLLDPVLIDFALDLNITQVSDIVEDVFMTRVRTKQQILQTNTFQCLFFDETSESLSGEGCWVSGFTRTEVTCACNHLTDFMAFVKESYSPWVSANYMAFTVLPSLSSSSLSSNLGFYLALVYFGTFFLFACIARRATQNLSTQERKILLLSELDISWKSKYLASPSSEASFTKESRQLSGSIKITSISNNQSKSPQQTHKAKRRTSSTSTKIMDRLTSVYSQNQRHRCWCCWVFCKLVDQELKANNQIYNLFCKTSVVSPRSFRLALFYFGILCELAVSAFFHDLSPSETETSLFSLASFLSNFWTGIYSLFLSMLLMCSIGCFLSIPTRWRVKLKKASLEQNLESEIERTEKKLRIRLICGFSFFFVVSCFLCLYLVGLSALANQASEQDWITSSLIAIVLDMSVFQVLPALAFSSLGLLVLACRVKCLECVLAALELYRAIRNFAIN